MSNETNETNGAPGFLQALFLDAVNIPLWLIEAGVFMYAWNHFITRIGAVSISFSTSLAILGIICLPQVVVSQIKLVKTFKPDESFVYQRFYGMIMGGLNILFYLFCFWALTLFN